MKTAVEWLVEQMIKCELLPKSIHPDNVLFHNAKEMEKNNTDNKVIHFAEWLTNKHTTTLITLYAQFEEEHYKENYESNI